MAFRKKISRGRALERELASLDQPRRSALSCWSAPRRKTGRTRCLNRRSTRSGGRFSCPVTAPDRCAKAAAAGADAIIIDLEDAVPAEAKGEAREALRNALPRRRLRCPCWYGSMPRARPGMRPTLPPAPRCCSRRS
ncbi:aldolase/citrate lyase family protein [Xanthobacter dioxanivorans]|nr:aldolase/citrate lyase family protein [Xanthobacter dioxanivorans]